jgi:hypothetical protein
MACNSYELIYGWRCVCAVACNFEFAGEQQARRHWYNVVGQQIWLKQGNHVCKDMKSYCRDHAPRSLLDRASAVTVQQLIQDAGKNETNHRNNTSNG